MLRHQCAMMGRHALRRGASAQVRAAGFGGDRGGHHHRVGNLRGAEPGGAESAIGALDHCGVDLHGSAVILRRAGLCRAGRDDSGDRGAVRVPARSIRTAVRVPLRVDLFFRSDLGGDRVAFHHVRNLPGIFRCADAAGGKGSRGGADWWGDAGELSGRGVGSGTPEYIHADEGGGAGGIGRRGIPGRPARAGGCGDKRGRRGDAERLRRGDDFLPALL